jgi:hypothetical protein
MNCAPLLLVGLLIASTALAAGQTEGTDTGAVSAQKTVDGYWEPTAFVEEAGRLPAGYKGLDPKKFLDMFKSRVAGLKKGEFETTAEFAQRTSNKDALLAPINTIELYAFRNDLIDSKYGFRYDADSQTYTIGGLIGNYSCSEAIWSDKWVICNVSIITRSHDTYEGTNAFGASRTVEREGGSNFALAFLKNSPLLSSVMSQRNYRYEYEDKLSVPLEHARRLKDMELAVLFVGRVGAAQIVENRSSYRPTLDWPREVSITAYAVPFVIKKIVYYVVQTGEILGQRDF